MEKISGPPFSKFYNCQMGGSKLETKIESWMPTGLKLCDQAATSVQKKTRNVKNFPKISFRTGTFVWESSLSRFRHINATFVCVKNTRITFKLSVITQETGVAKLTIVEC